MSLRVVGAGLGRTGTHSLKLALEQLLGAPCYHMIEVFGHPEHIASWQQAADGNMPDWDALFDGYAAAVDWPVASFWREVSEAYPDALILLSERDPDAWWKSANDTIFNFTHRPPAEGGDRAWFDMVSTMMRNRFTADLDDEAAAKAAFVRHNDDVRRTAPKDRLLEWRTGEGWAPLCDVLGVAVPDAPFPHVNTTEEFRAMSGLDDS
jgi:sulfotransferase family protein